MFARVTMIVVAATLAIATVPASADIVPSDPRGREAPIPVPAPHPDGVPKPAPTPHPQPPTPEKDSAAPFVAAGFLAMFALLWLWFVRGSGRRAQI
jgi:hypothetical protein